MSALLTLDDLRHLIADHLERPLAEVGADTRLIEDLAVESLDFYALLVEIEEHTGVLAPLRAVREASTVAQLHSAVLSGLEAA